MSCHVADHAAATRPALLRLRAHPLRVALVGNPNVGKSVVFGRLTGRYATVSNYPGTTVAVTKGRALVGAEVCDIIDTPGVNALEGSLTEDEQITRTVLAGDASDLVVQVVDARNIRRALMLTAQLAALRKPRPWSAASRSMPKSWPASSVCRSSNWWPSKGAASRPFAARWPMPARCPCLLSATSHHRRRGRMR
jgi:hypothetical protein